MSNYNSDNYFNYKYQNSINILILKIMNMTAELKNGENVLTVDCQNKKMYFNGNEVIMIAMNFEGGVLMPNPYALVERFASFTAEFETQRIVKVEAMQRYLDDPAFFDLYAFTYKDSETNKEHIIDARHSEWQEVGSGWDSIEALNDVEDSCFYVLANGINDGKTVDHIRIEKYGEF